MPVTSPATLWFGVGSTMRTETLAITAASVAVIAERHSVSFASTSACGVSAMSPASPRKRYVPLASVVRVSGGSRLLTRRTISPGTGFALGSAKVALSR